MKELILTQGKVALVDDADFNELAQWSWCFDNGYAHRKEKGRKIYLHRQILGLLEGGAAVDHIDGDKLNNQKLNLRIATRQQNSANTGLKANSTTGFKGVARLRNSRKNPYRAYLVYNRKQHHLGCFKTQEAAAAAYNEAAVLKFKEYARLNQIEA